jgi:hypothetical protein
MIKLCAILNMHKIPAESLLEATESSFKLIEIYLFLRNKFPFLTTHILGNVLGKKTDPTNHN